jgi:hypothetical protein
MVNPASAVDPGLIRHKRPSVIRRGEEASPARGLPEKASFPILSLEERKWGAPKDDGNPENRNT